MFTCMLLSACSYDTYGQLPVVLIRLTNSLSRIDWEENIVIVMTNQYSISSVNMPCNVSGSTPPKKSENSASNNYLIKGI
jgi:hypothetical protein